MRVFVFVWLALLGCSGPAAPPRDAGHDAPFVRDAWFGDTNASDTGACATTPSPADVSSILVTNCALSGCHSRTSPEAPGGLEFDRGDPHGQLAGVASSYAGIYEVVPGDPGHSLLWRKVTNDLAPGGTEGAPMPLGDPAHWVSLPPDQLETIRCWIAGGAL